MIPKIIHLCWLSGDAFPTDIVKCLETWKKYLKDYEIWLWGKKPQDCLGLNVIEKHFDLDSTIWTKQAFEAKKYAFAADYIILAEFILMQMFLCINHSMNCCHCHISLVVIRFVHLRLLL